MQSDSIVKGSERGAIIRRRARRAGRAWLSGCLYALYATVLPVAANGSEWKDDLHVHGFVSQGYLHSTDNHFLAPTEDGTFDFFEAGVNISTELSDQLRMGMQLFSRNLGDQGRFNVIVDWAYGDYRWRDALGFRLGRIKTPLGLYNQVRDFDFLRTPAILPSSLYNDEFRDILVATSGGGLYGHLPTPALGDFSYEVVGGTVEIEEDMPLIRNELAQIPALVTDVDISVRYLYAGSLQWDTPLDGFRMASSYLTLNSKASIAGPEFAAQTLMKLDGYVLSAEYLRGPLTVAAEYGLTDVDMSLRGVPGEDGLPSFQSEGYYGLIAWRFTDWLEAGAYYSEYFGDRNDRSGRRFEALDQPDYRAWQKDLALTLRFDLHPQWLVKLEAHQLDGGAQVHPFDNPDGITRNWELFVAKTTFIF